MKQKKITMQEHQELGAELKKLNEYSAKMACKIDSTYGSSKKISKLALRFHRLISEMKSEMENQCFRDYPREANIDVYYGPSPQITNPHENNKNAKTAQTL